MKRIIAASMALLTMAVAMPLSAQPVIDGQLDPTGYTRVATQTNNTGFGDNQSEWNALYVAVDGTRIYVLVTGNLENNFNKLEVFFDSVPGGENALSSIPEYDFPDDNPPISWNSQRLGGPFSLGPGLTFDAGFECDYHMFVRHGFDPEAADLGFNVIDADFIDRLEGTSAIINGNSFRAAFDFDLQIGSGAITPDVLANNAAEGVIANDIPVALDNNNMAGVSDDTSVPADATAAEAVTTGLEFSIDVDDLGLDPQESGVIKMMILQNGSNHDFVSNQILPGIDAPNGNLGGDNAGGFTGDCGMVNMNAWTGDQFVCIEYTPGGDCAFALGDINEDGEINLLDVGPFVALLSGGGGFLCQADINGDGMINLLDVDPFVALLGG